MSEQGQASATVNPHRREAEKRMRDMASAVLSEVRMEAKLCDVVIKVDEVEFDAHKIILCSCSPYFRALFTGAWAISTKQLYTIPGVSPEMMQLIINYAYTHSPVPVTQDNVVEILAAADQLLVSGIIQTCWFFLEDQLCPMNCVGIWRLMGFYHMPEQRNKVFLYILYRFEQIVSDSQELLELSVQQLVAIFESDHLNVRQETTVFEAVLRWINHQPEQRRGHISELLPKVRLGLMNIYYLQNSVIDNDVVKNSSECIPIISDALTAFLDFRNRSSNFVYSNLLNRPRLPFTMLLVTGGKNDSIAATGLEVYDAHADCWVTLNTGEICRAHHGAAVLNNFVYLIGGCYTESYLNTVQRFDIVTRTWHQVAPMNFCRCYVSVVVQNGCIYAIGGFNGVTYYNSVECYRPDIDRWTMVAPMRSKRCAASATTLNGKVYICGGFNGHRSLCTAECYDPETNQWTPIAPMRSSRSGLGVTAYRDRLYAVGGNLSEDCHLRTVEAYNPLTNWWTPTPSMDCPRSYFGIEVVDEQLFVVGGYGGSSTILSVECYNEETGLWLPASNIETARSGLSCCVLHGLQGVAEDLFSRGPLMLPDVEEDAGAPN